MDGQERGGSFVKDYQIVAVIIFCISFIGAVANWLVATMTLRLPTMKNSFGRLLSSQSTGEAILCSTFAFLYSPMVFFELNVLKDSSRRLGMILLICYDICIYSHLFIALNRLVAICLPLQYKTFFSRKNTKAFIAASWVGAVIPALIMYGYNDCDFIYEGSIWTFVFTQTEACKFISWNIDFYKDISIVAIIAVLDIITIIRVHILNLKMRKTQLQMDKSRSKEINFLRQAVLQGIVFTVELFTYFYLAWQFESKWVTWCLSTVAWNIVHCTDALIIIGFNAEFRKLVSSPTHIFEGRTSVTHIEPAITNLSSKH